MTKGTAKKTTVKPTASTRKVTSTNVTTNTNNTPNVTKGNFHEIAVGTPCRIFVDKKTAAMYITTNTTTIVSKKNNTNR